MHRYVHDFFSFKMNHIFIYLFPFFLLKNKFCQRANFNVFIDVLMGYNGTIFAYGQTSSGKTHTMEVKYKFNL